MCACAGVRARVCACACVRVRVRARVYVYVGKDSAAPAHARTRIHAHTGPRRHARARVNPGKDGGACGLGEGVLYMPACVPIYCMCARACGMRAFRGACACVPTHELSQQLLYTLYTCTSYRSIININIIKKENFVKVSVFFFLQGRCSCHRTSLAAYTYDIPTLSRHALPASLSLPWDPQHKNRSTEVRRSPLSRLPEPTRARTAK